MRIKGGMEDVGMVGDVGGIGTVGGIVVFLLRIDNYDSVVMSRLLSTMVIIIINSQSSIFNSIFPIGFSSILTS